MSKLFSFLVIVFFGFISSSVFSQRFTVLKPQETGIYFRSNNDIVSSPFEGSGVGVADFDNDGLLDIFFAGSPECKLYRNKGNLQFEDITEKSGIKTGTGATSVALADLNNDGLTDIIIGKAKSFNDNPEHNILIYLNTNSAVFHESSSALGVNSNNEDISRINIFDINNDGFLDIIIHHWNGFETSYMGMLISDEKDAYLGLYDKVFIHKEGSYIDVTQELKFSVKTKNHTVFNSFASDINQDGWIDVLVSNDFNNPDYVFINHNGAEFKNTTDSFFKATSYYSMGSDAADINNDGFIDLFTCDMRPANNRNSKLLLFETPYTWHYIFSEKKSFIQNQFVRNTLQLNNADGTFSEIGQFAGVDATDWSWSSLFADFDNDGYKDLFITNGINTPEIYEYDFVHRITEETPIPPIDNSVKEYFKNYIYNNNGNFTFSNKQLEWGFETPIDSRGAAYADLDNDGDLDLVVNNNNALSFIYRNDLNTTNNFFRLSLKYESNLPAWHSSATIYYANGKIQFSELNPIRGFYSSSEPLLHFGISKEIIIDSILIKWNNGYSQKLYNQEVNKFLSIVFDSTKAFKETTEVKKYNSIFEEDTTLVKFIHKGENEIDFRENPLLPNQYSNMFAPLVTADLNGDGLDDFVAGNGKNTATKIFIQNNIGNFNVSSINDIDSVCIDAAILIVDIDNDGDNDIFIASGGYSSNSNLKCRLYLNDGKGIYEKAKSSPQISVSASSLVATNILNIKQTEIFVGGRVKALRYPETPESYLLLYKNGKWENIIDSVAPDLKFIGMVSDAVYTDFDNDGFEDLIVVGEYMQPEFFKNNGKGKLIRYTNSIIFNQKIQGFWNSIVATDIDEDGDIDYVLGNLGENNRWKATQQYPLELFGADFDNNGSIDIISAYYEDGKLYPIKPLNELKTRINGLSKKYYKHAFFANATIEDMFGKEALQNAIHLKAYETASGILYNNGGGRYTFRKLPAQAQWSPVYGILADDINNDGIKDILLTGNFDYPEIERGKYTAMNGLVLLGTKQNYFKVLNTKESGFLVKEEGRKIVTLTKANGKKIFLANQNNSIIKAFHLNK